MCYYKIPVRAFLEKEVSPSHPILSLADCSGTAGPSLVCKHELVYSIYFFFASIEIDFFLFTVIPN